MVINIGWPEGIYLAVNIICIAFLACGERGYAKALGYTVTWLFFTLPLLFWGGFFA